MTKRTAALLAPGLLALFLLAGIDGARRETPTVDEFAHVPSGCAILRHGAFDLYAHNPPLAKMLMALPVVLSGAEVPVPTEPRDNEWSPWIYGSRFMWANQARYFDLFFRARLVALAITALGGVFLLLLARSLFGGKAAIGALFLYVASPTLQAHGRLATLDAAASTGLLGAFLALDAYRRRPGTLRLLLAGLALGLALLTKFTAVLALPAFAVVLFLATRGERVPRRLARLALALAVALLVVGAGYGIRDVGERLDSFPLQSAFGRGMARVLPAGLPMPVPRELLLGLDAEKKITERGEFGTYWHGRWHQDGPWYYNAGALLLKEPLGVWGLLALALAGLRTRRGPLPDEALCWLVPVSLLLAFTFGSRLNIGVRYLLPALPFLYLGISRVFPDLTRASLRTVRGFAVAAGALAVAAASLLAQPHPLGSFNLLAGGPANGHRWLIDSNLDWGQDLFLLRPWMEANAVPSVSLLYFGHVDPLLYGIDYTLPSASPRPGTYVVSVNFAKGYPYVAPDHGRVLRIDGGAPAWLRAATPAETIGSSLWVYRIAGPPHE